MLDDDDWVMALDETFEDKCAACGFVDYWCEYCGFHGHDCPKDGAELGNL